MSGLYSQFETDTTIERTGVWLDYGKNSKGQDIRIRIARAGGANEAYLKKLESRSKPMRRQIQNETIERARLEGIVRETYAETVILAWEGVEDRDGNLLPFSKDNVIKVLTDLPDLFLDIQEQSTRAALFRKEIRETDGKN